MMQTQELLLRKVESIVACRGINFTETRVLVILHYKPQPVIVSDIAHLLLEKPQTTVAILDRMEAKGLVRRIRDLQDRRLVRIEATDKAKRIFEANAPSVRASVDRLFSALSVEELNQFENMLVRVRATTIDELGMEYQRLDVA